jgi:hypothetical protein
MDTSATNGYLITTHGNEDIGHRAHRNYQETLAMELLLTPHDGLSQVVEPIVTQPQPCPR